MYSQLATVPDLLHKTSISSDLKTCQRLKTTIDGLDFSADAKTFRQTVVAPYEACLNTISTWVTSQTTKQANAQNKIFPDLCETRGIHFRGSIGMERAREGTMKMLKATKPFFYTWLLLAAVGTPSFVETVWAETCQDLPLVEAIPKGKQLAAGLEIAYFNADLREMEQAAKALLTFIDPCMSQGDSPSDITDEHETTGKDQRLSLVCDFNCFVQLGRYYLFQASDLPYLSNTSKKGTSFKPADAAKAVEQGLSLLHQGIHLLIQQQQSKSPEDSIRSFVRQLTHLNILRCKLHTIGGDTWYRTATEGQVKHLHVLLSDTLSSTRNAGIESDTNFSNAFRYYEQALWTLIEAKTDIPDDGTYGDLEADLYQLHHDLQKRVRSLKKGFLYLGIDPNVSPLIPFKELNAKLKKTHHKLEEIEAKIQNIIQTWINRKQQQAAENVDEQRMVRQQEANLAAHKIAKMEAEAQAFSTTVNLAIQQVEEGTGHMEIPTRPSCLGV